VRLFVAIYPPEDARADLRRWLTQRGTGVRLTRVERWHLTLSFLGEVAPERRPEVEQALDGVRPPGRIRLRMSGGGSFGRRRSAALWAGVDGDLPALREVHARVREALKTADLRYDERPFTPHLTVAYAAGTEIRAALAEYAGPAWTADEFVLVHSLHHQGGGYRTLRAWPMA